MHCPIRSEVLEAWQSIRSGVLEVRCSIRPLVVETRCSIGFRAEEERCSIRLLALEDVEHNGLSDPMASCLADKAAESERSMTVAGEDGVEPSHPTMAEPTAASHHSLDADYTVP